MTCDGQSELTLRHANLALIGGILTVVALYWLEVNQYLLASAALAGTVIILYLGLNTHDQ